MNARDAKLYFAKSIDALLTASTRIALGWWFRPHPVFYAFVVWAAISALLVLAEPERKVKREDGT